MADAQVVMNYATIKQAAQKRSNERGTHYRLYQAPMGWTIRVIPRESLRAGVKLSASDELISPFGPSPLGAFGCERTVD